jgi:hypothetical protein
LASILNRVEDVIEAHPESLGVAIKEERQEDS